MIQDYVQYNPSKIIFGHGAEEKTAQEIKRLGGTRVLLHYDAGAFIKPLIARIRTQLKAAGLYVVELGGVVPNPLKENLKTSYRQSKKLLEVARQIYIDTLDEKPSYRAFMKSNKVPAPLVFINEQEHEKVQWIAQRIAEVYKATGSNCLPSLSS